MSFWGLIPVFQSRAADIDIPNLASGSLWLYNRAHPTTFILSDALIRLAQPFNDISTLLNYAIPIGERAAIRAQDAGRELHKARLKDGGPEDLKLAIRSAPIIYDNLRLIKDYIEWYNTLSVRRSVRYLCLP